MPWELDFRQLNQHPLLLFTLIAAIAVTVRGPFAGLDAFTGRASAADHSGAHRAFNKPYYQAHPDSAYGISQHYPAATAFLQTLLPQGSAEASTSASQTAEKRSLGVENAQPRSQAACAWEQHAIPRGDPISVEEREPTYFHQGNHASTSQPEAHPRQEGVEIAACGQFLGMSTSLQDHTQLQASKQHQAPNETVAHLQQHDHRKLQLERAEHASAYQLHNPASILPDQLPTPILPSTHHGFLDSSDSRGDLGRQPFATPSSLVPIFRHSLNTHHGGSHINGPPFYLRLPASSLTEPLAHASAAYCQNSVRRLASSSGMAEMGSSRKRKEPELSQSCHTEVALQLRIANELQVHSSSYKNIRGLYSSGTLNCIPQRPPRGTKKTT